MTPISLPKTPPQPNAAAYPVSDLYLFRQYSRESYLAEFGVPAPDFDPTQDAKSWFDTSNSTGQNTYDVVVGSNPAVVTGLTLDASVAARPNLPGNDGYPAYTPARTTVATSGGQPINADMLCSYADALTLAQVFGGANAPVPTEDPNDASVVWGSETRRSWNVQVVPATATDPAVVSNAATLLMQMWQYGIGAPGSWDLTNPTAPKWIQAPTPTIIGTMPVPIRPLLPGEVIQAGPAGIGTEVVNTNMQPQPTPSGGGGGLTAQQAAQLQSIFEWVQGQTPVTQVGGAAIHPVKEATPGGLSVKPVIKG